MYAIKCPPSQKTNKQNNKKREGNHNPLQRHKEQCDASVSCFSKQTLAKYNLRRKDMDQAATLCGCFSESTSINDTEDKVLLH